MPRVLALLSVRRLPRVDQASDAVGVCARERGIQADALHMLGLRPTSHASLDALCHRGALAASASQGVRQSVDYDFPYPKEANVVGFFDETIEAAMNLANDTVHSIRSLAQNFNVNGNKDIKVYIVAKTDAAKGMLGRVLKDIDTLGKCKSELSDAPPKGCAMELVGTDTEVHMYLKGLIDPSKELARIDKAYGKTKKAYDALMKRISFPGYEQKVPKGVQEKNAAEEKKLSEKLKTLDASKVVFQAMIGGDDDGLVTMICLVTMMAMTRSFSPKWLPALKSRRRRSQRRAQ